jgi:hypothetical protein
MTHTRIACFAIALRRFFADPDATRALFTSVAMMNRAAWEEAVSESGTPDFVFLWADMIAYGSRWLSCSGCQLPGHSVSQDIRALPSADLRTTPGNSLGLRRNDIRLRREPRGVNH